MKTVCTKSANKSIHIFNDDCSFEARDGNIFIKDENGNTILVLSNSSLYLTYENITVPDTWASGKYRYTTRRGWIRCSDWKFPYEEVFRTLYEKHLQLVQCLYEKSTISDEDLLLLCESKTIEERIIEHKIKYENPMS